MDLYFSPRYKPAAAAPASLEDFDQDPVLSSVLVY